jgi:glycosyltransferase involved in cell wall biosynthesis
VSRASLSVVMANYNHARYLPESLGAILSQSRRATEVIVVDDGSTDDSAVVLERFVRQDDRVRVLYNGQNRGVVTSATRALDAARGDYVYSGSADDCVLPGLFEKSLAALERYPQAGLCCSEPATFIDGSRDVRPNALALSDRPTYFSPEHVVALMRRKRLWIAGHTSVMRRSAVLEAGALLPSLRWHSDWFLLLVIAFRHGICYIPEALAAIRIRPDSYSAVGMRRPALQRQVVRNVLRQLDSASYRDVRPRFKASDALVGLPSSGQAILSRPRDWDLVSAEIARVSLFRPLRSRIARATPQWGKRLYRQLSSTP